MSNKQNDIVNENFMDNVVNTLSDQVEINKKLLARIEKLEWEVKNIKIAIA